MKKKSLLVLSAVFVTALVLGSTSCSKSDKSLFGGIPTVYEEEMIDIFSEMKDIVDDKKNGKEIGEERGLSLFANFEAAVNRAIEKAKPMADEMIGKSLHYTQSDSLPYKIVSDIEVKDVTLPQLNLLGSPKMMRLEVEYDVVFTQEQDSPVKMYYFIMADDQPVDYEDIWQYKSMDIGDTLHVKTDIVAPDIPSQYLESCDELRFVTYQNYKANKDNIKKQQKEWNEAHVKKLGLSDE